MTDKEKAHQDYLRNSIGDRRKGRRDFVYVKAIVRIPRADGSYTFGESRLSGRPDPNVRLRTECADILFHYHAATDKIEFFDVAGLPVAFRRFECTRTCADCLRIDSGKTSNRLSALEDHFYAREEDFRRLVAKVRKDFPDAADWKECEAGLDPDLPSLPDRIAGTARAAKSEELSPNTIRIGSATATLDPLGRPALPLKQRTFTEAESKALRRAQEEAIADAKPKRKRKKKKKATGSSGRAK